MSSSSTSRKQKRRTSTFAPPPQLARLWLFRCVDWASRNATHARTLRKQMQSALNDAVTETVATTLSQVESTLKRRWTQRTRTEYLTHPVALHAATQALQHSMAHLGSHPLKSAAVALNQVSVQQARTWLFQRISQALDVLHVGSCAADGNRPRTRTIPRQRHRYGPKTAERAAYEAATTLMQPVLHRERLSADQVKVMFRQLIHECEALAAEAVDSLETVGSSANKTDDNKDDADADAERQPQTTRNKRTASVNASAQVIRRRAALETLAAIRQQLEDHGVWLAATQQPGLMQTPPKLSALRWPLPDVLALSILRFLSVQDSYQLAQVSRGCLDLVWCSAPRWWCALQLYGSVRTRRLAAAYQYVLKTQRGLQFPLHQLDLDLQSVRPTDLGVWRSKRVGPLFAQVRTLRLRRFPHERFPSVLQLFPRLERLVVEFEQWPCPCHLPWLHLRECHLRELCFVIPGDYHTKWHHDHVCVPGCGCAALPPCTDSGTTGCEWKEKAPDGMAIRITFQFLGSGRRDDMTDTARTWASTFLPWLSKHVCISSCVFDNVPLHATVKGGVAWLESE